MVFMNRLLQGFLTFCLLTVSLSACSNAPSYKDGKIITDDPRDYLLKPVDFDAANNFYIPENDAFVILNEMAVGSLGKEKGEALVADQERVVGWRVHYQANKEDQDGPQVYLSTITQHQSAKGAQAAVEKYNSAALYPDGGWIVEDVDLNMGDKYIVETGATENSQGRRAVTYRIEFAFRNISADILVYGLEKEVNQEMAVKAARAVLLRLHTAPFGTGPVPTPTP